MDGHGSHRRGAGREPRGPLSRRPANGGSRWRRAVEWLLGGRDDVDQRGLLAERTLGVVKARDDPPAEEPRDDSRAEPPR
jgi:hypothetical protein